MYRELYGEYTYWCNGVKGEQSLFVVNSWDAMIFLEQEHLKYFWAIIFDNCRVSFIYGLMINLIVNLIRESWFSLFLSFFKRYLLLPVNSDVCRLCFQGPDEEIFGKFFKDINTGFSVHQYCMVRNDSFTNLKFFCM